MRVADRMFNLEGDFPSSDNEGALSCLPHLRAKRPDLLRARGDVPPHRSLGSGDFSIL